MGCVAIARLTVIETLRRREFYIVVGLVAGLAVWIQMMNVDTSAAGRFSKDIVMQVTWLASFALAVPLAARQIGSDLEHKTVYVLASRAIHRRNYVLGRTIGAVWASVACFAGLFGVLIFMLLLKGAGSIGDPALWQAFFFQVIALTMVCSIAVLLSTVFTSGGSIAFTLMILAIMKYGGQALLHKVEEMSGALQQVAWATYLIAPHFEFFDVSQRVVHGWGALPMSLFAQIAVYGVAYSIVCVSLAAIIFRRRWL